MYGDVLYGLSLQSGDVHFQYKRSGASLEYEMTTPLNTTLTEFSKIGGRIGCNWVNRGLSVSTELGVRPGITPRLEASTRIYGALICSYRFGSIF